MTAKKSQFCILILTEQYLISYCGCQIRMCFLVQMSTFLLSFFFFPKEKKPEPTKVFCQFSQKQSYIRIIFYSSITLNLALVNSSSQNLFTFAGTRQANERIYLQELATPQSVLKFISYWSFYYQRTHSFISIVGFDR